MEQPNLSYIHSMSRGDKAFERKLIDIIKEELSKEKATYFDGINAKNYQISVNHVHKLKHKIGIFGLNQSYEIAVRFEDNLREGKTELQDEFESILQVMTNFLRNL